MLLTCDIGNTNSKFALYDGSNRISFFVLSNKEIASLPNFIKHKVDGCAISSVAPGFTLEVEKIITSNYNVLPYFINSRSRFHFKISYNPPESLGIDRICAAEGALAQTYGLKAYLLAVDCGTATTVNIVNDKKEFIGGLIMPGLFTMSKSLNKNTAQLPETTLEHYNNIIGNTTIGCIESGLLNSTAGMIDRALEHLHKNLKADLVKLYVTGGASKYLAPLLNPDFTYVEDLVLSGIKSVYELNK